MVSKQTGNEQSERRTNARKKQHSNLKSINVDHVTKHANLSHFSALL